MTNLYPHNQRAYDAVMNHYAKGNKKACVIQPCGTGKSYVLAAVASNYDKVYVIAPNEHVLDQAKSACDREVICQTYSLISTNNYNVPTDADLIVFDEMHRMGAISWSKGCERLMNANPNAHILGLTATPERALEQRDMSQEYFEGHVVSNMSLTDAWCDKVLKTPQKYVVGLVSMDNDKRDRIEKINNSKWLNSEQKKSACAKVINLCRDWALGNGVPRIISKYWDSNIKKCVVFAPTINSAETLEPTIRGWFSEAGYPINKVYVAHSESESAAQTIEEFENNEEGLNILISVSMLNEGIHPKGVAAAILLRATISRNLYMQQIGRCFSVGQEVAPIIFDLSDNLTSANSYDEIYQARDRFMREGGYVDDKSESASERHENLDTFQIIDTIKTTRDLMAEIDKEIVFSRSLTFDEIKEIASKYIYVKDFRENEPVAFRQAYKKGWLPEITKDMISLKRKVNYTVEGLKELADGCSGRKDFKLKYPSEYSWVLNHGVKEEVFANLQPTYQQHTKEECLEAVKQCKNRKDFQNRFSKLEAFARARGWIDELFEGRESDKSPYINNKQYCIKWCSQFMTKADAERANPNICRYIYNHDWADECFAHTIDKSTARRMAVRKKIVAFLEKNGRKPKSTERSDYNRFQDWKRKHPRDMEELLAKYVK